MADRDYKAFIVEGEVREPQIIDNILKVFFSHDSFKIITLPAEENIYMLWKKLKADDFDTDIIEVLRESNDDKGSFWDEVRETVRFLRSAPFLHTFFNYGFNVHRTMAGNNIGMGIKPACFFGKVL